MLLNNYINGKIGGIKKRKLENDINFMIDVIKLTKDKKYYYNVSRGVKNNISFINFIMDFFRDDEEFVNEVLDNYLSCNSVNLDGANVIAKGLLWYNNYNCYEIIFNIYLSLKDDLLREKNNLNEDEKENYGLGFKRIYDVFGNQEYLMECFVTMMLVDIFDDDLRDNFKVIVKEEISLVTDLKEFKEGSFLLKYIAGWDKDLADYLNKNRSFLSKYIDEVREIILEIKEEEREIKNKIVNRVKALENDKVNVWYLLSVLSRRKGIKIFKEYSMEKSIGNDFMNLRYKELIEEIIDEEYFGKKRESLNTEVIKLNLK